MRSSITKRWVRVSLLTTMFILIFAEIIAVVFIGNSYYSAAENAILSRVNTINGTLSASGNLSDGERTQLVYRMAEDFGEKDKFEFMVIGTDGTVLTTSTGVIPIDDDHMRDIRLAQQAFDGIATNTYRTSMGERVMTGTCILRRRTDVVYAVRLVTSLSKIDQQMGSVIMMAVILFFAIVVFAVQSGLYFVRSIVGPVREIERSAALISKGEFGVRIDNTYHDEIGQLCDAINDMAQELGRTDDIKNEFISSVSHELRTPLTAIKGWAETMNSPNADSATVQKGTEIILSETERLYSMVENLLDFSRLQQSDMKMTMEKLDLVAEIDDAVLMFAPRCQQNGIDLVYEEPSDIVPVMGDRNRLKQVMVNLLDNSIKYSHIGGKIQVSLQQDKRHNTVSVSVWDDGTGIQAEDIEKVTQKFYKGKGAKRGSGIGLALVKEIISAHGGNFTVESEYGSYTKMTFTLNTLKNTKGK